jgi:hypothetical protein
MKKNNLPVFEIFIDEAENSFVDAIALVDKPAIESDFLSFNKEETKFQFSVDDENRMELIGAALIPDLNIYRQDANGDGYYVSFSKDTVRNIAQVFMKKGLQNSMNIEHSETPAHSYVYQSFIVDKDKGINSPKTLNLPDGSWVVGVKVTDNAVWNDIKQGKTKGFSVEGIFKIAEKKVKKTQSKEEQEVFDLIKEIEVLIKERKDRVNRLN